MSGYCAATSTATWGAGEGGIVAVAATAANAVAAALASTGVELRELPLSPAHVWKLLGRGAGG